MAYRVAVDSIGDGIRYDLGVTDRLFVPTDVAVISNTTSAIEFSGYAQSIRVYGLVAASGHGIYNSNPDMVNVQQTDILIGKTGIIDSNVNGIQLAGAVNKIVNYGAISGVVDGIALYNSGTNFAGTIINYGSITGFAAIFADSKGTVQINNYGTITGEASAIDTEASRDGGDDLVVNRGQIDGSIYLGDGADKLTNRGLISGLQLSMGTGADVLDNRGGTIDIAIQLGDGADIFMPGTSEETANGGGDQYDKLDFSRSSGLQIALDGSIDNTGWAAGDTYSGFTDVTGSILGADTLIGDGSINTLRGLGGNDSISGQAGVDFLYGGAGNDTLNGGTGADQLFGGAGNDTLIGGDDKSDFLSGEAGNDRLISGGGSDILAGGTGTDTFVYTAKTDFGGTALGSREQLNDFSSAERDKIDLSAIDASTKVTGNQAFTFIGTTAFTNVAGQLRFEVSGSFIIVQGDLNGDSVADIALDLNGITNVAAADFVL